MYHLCRLFTLIILMIIFFIRKRKEKREKHLEIRISLLVLSWNIVWRIKYSEKYFKIGIFCNISFFIEKRIEVGEKPKNKVVFGIQNILISSFYFF